MKPNKKENDSKITSGIPAGIGKIIIVGFLIVSIQLPNKTQESLLF